MARKLQKVWSDIPVLKCVGIEYNYRYCNLVMEYIEGIPMSDIPETKKLLVHAEIQRHMNPRRTLKSKNIGGLSGLVISPTLVREITYNREN
jgi:hypothetical protein